MIKKILIGCGIFFVVLMIIGGLVSEDTTPEAAEAAPQELKQTEPKAAAAVKDVEAKDEETDKNKLTDAKKAEIVAYFKSDEEPSVADALFPYSTLKLGMHNDGSNRDGFAKYACQILQSEFGATELVTVSIIDIDKLVHTDKWVKIGKANCI
ncbi:MAG: hypothetical protein L0G63_01945 [Psychrobacter sp.]|uniref:hypothetical protein n=1 Tax=Psychrobacter sp. TaxID=56811 RepID=UPI0026477FE4|nr:hypothetical protein [Psychrobacter sp.]MDN5619230.1 hypothetical protein [Psychrobacter sp.]